MGRYLVTGGAGFIGSHLCDRLVHDGHQVVILDNFSSGHRKNLASVAANVSIFDANVIDGIDKGVLGKFDGVVHLAALISGFDSLKQPDDYVRANISGLLRVIEFVRDSGSGRLIFASSSTVYGSAAKSLLDEETLPRPISVYAATKLLGEQLLAMYSGLYGFSHCSLRLFNVYGPRQATDHPYANVTCKFSHAAANGLPIDLYGRGDQSRDFIYVDDVVDAFTRVLTGAPSELYNIGTGLETSIIALITTLEQIVANSLEVNAKPEWPNDIQRISSDSTRAFAELDYRARTGVHEGLARTVEYFRAEP